MRIIGGVFGSRAVEMPKGVAIRPTQDRVREAVFNMLAADIEGARVLDLFAGSGAFGLEALSRGAQRAVFVDRDARCCAAITRTRDRLGIPPASAPVIRSDAVKALGALESGGEVFDLIFLDPPYHRDLAKNCLIKLLACDIVATYNKIIIERFKKDALEARNDLMLVTERRYGDTVISIFKKGER